MTMNDKDFFIYLYEQSKLDVMETLLGTKTAIIKPPK